MVTGCLGTGLVLRRDDIDTDQIVAAEHCKRIGKSGYADVLFSRWREDASFALNLPGASQAKILIAGHNFGTGSSREHAVWALKDWGFEAVIATSFGDIFQRNALKNRLLAVQLTPTQIGQLGDLVSWDTQTVIRVDLMEQVVEAGALSFQYSFDERSRRSLLAEVDEIAAVLEDVKVIGAHEQMRPTWLPVVSLSLPAKA